MIVQVGFFRRKFGIFEQNPFGQTILACLLEIRINPGDVIMGHLVGSRLGSGKFPNYSNINRNRTAAAFFGLHCQKTGSQHTSSLSTKTQQLRSCTNYELMPARTELPVAEELVNSGRPSFIQYSVRVSSGKVSHPFSLTSLRLKTEKCKIIQHQIIFYFL